MSQLFAAKVFLFFGILFPTAFSQEFSFDNFISIDQLPIDQSEKVIEELERKIGQSNVIKIARNGWDVDTLRSAESVAAEFIETLRRRGINFSSLDTATSPVLKFVRGGTTYQLQLPTQITVRNNQIVPGLGPYAALVYDHHGLYYTGTANPSEATKNTTQKVIETIKKVYNEALPEFSNLPASQQVAERVAAVKTHFGKVTTDNLGDAVIPIWILNNDEAIAKIATDDSFFNLIKNFTIIEDFTYFSGVFDPASKEAKFLFAVLSVYDNNLQSLSSDRWMYNAAGELLSVEDQIRYFNKVGADLDPLLKDLMSEDFTQINRLATNYESRLKVLAKRLDDVAGSYGDDLMTKAFKNTESRSIFAKLFHVYKDPTSVFPDESLGRFLTWGVANYLKSAKDQPFTISLTPTTLPDGSRVTKVILGVREGIDLPIDGLDESLNVFGNLANALEAAAIKRGQATDTIVKVGRDKKLAAYFVPLNLSDQEIIDVIAETFEANAPMDELKKVLRPGILHRVRGKFTSCSNFIARFF